MPDLHAPDEVWNHVRIELPPQITLGGDHYEPSEAYISFEGSVDWEPEHGLQLVVADGVCICKVGPYDGHVTNASDDLSLVDVVYHGG